MKTTKHMFAVLAVVSTTAFAQYPMCRSYEYAELKDMPREQLEKQYCQFFNYSRGAAQAATIARDGRVWGLAEHMNNEAAHCVQEVHRHETLLGRTTPEQQAPAAVQEFCAERATR